MRLICDGGPYSRMELKFNHTCTAYFSVPSFMKGQVGRYVKRDAVFCEWQPKV